MSRQNKAAQNQADTPQRILDESLALFALNGFEATSVSDIAKAVGIKAPSLYKHYASKQAIFDALVARQIDRHEQLRRKLNGEAGGLERDVLTYTSKSPTDMSLLAVGLFDHWTTGDAAKFRRMLSVERLRSPELSSLYGRMFLTDPLEYQTRLFARFIETGFFKDADPQTLATQFWGPLLMLMELADHDEDREALREMVRNHVVSFGTYYGNEAYHA